MGFSRQEHWSGLPFPSGDLPNPGISEMNNSSETKDRREKLELFCYYEISYIGSGIVLFESAFGVLHIKNSNKTNRKSKYEL